jgi:transcriptional regulator with XRE-family HTH domain
MIAYPFGSVNVDQMSRVMKWKPNKEAGSDLRQAVRRLRLALGDTQQAFANRLGLAISTVVRYELSRPPRGQALAQLERVASEHALDDCAMAFRNAIRDEMAPKLPSDVRPPAAATVGFDAWPQTPEEDAMVFDVLALMREAGRSGAFHQQAKKELEQLRRATQRVRADRIEAIELGQANEDQRAAVVRLSKLGVPIKEIAQKVEVPESKIERILEDHQKRIGEEE